MGKTNHRENKDRQEKLGEAKAHKQRRGIRQDLDRFIEMYEQGEDPEGIADEFFDDPELYDTDIKRQRYA